MRILPPGFQAHLDSGTTTLCWCWRLVRRDGLVQGFTDHDRDLEFFDTVFLASTGFTGTEINSSIGLNVDNLDVDGALSSESLNEDDLVAGLYDDAKVEIYRVNWADVSQAFLVQYGSIGEVKRSRVGFTAEVRGLAHYLQQSKGRLFQYSCDAELGDEQCNVDLSDPKYTGRGTITELSGRRIFKAEGLNQFEENWFTRGLLTWISGANRGRSIEVKSNSAVGQLTQLEIWLTLPGPITIGDEFQVQTGCDKQFTTCARKFLNQINYRGFPHMPGNDFIVSYPNIDDANNDGQSQF